MLAAAPRTPPRAPAVRDPPLPGEGDASDLILTTRSASESHQWRSAIGETHLLHRLHPLLFSSFTKEEGGRNAGKRWSPPPHLAMRHAPCRARSLVGVPPRLSPQGIIPSQRLSFRPGFLGRGLNGRYPPSPVPVQGSTSHPGHNAGRHDAQAAREQTANPPAGTAPAPPFGLPPEGVLRESGINSYVIGAVTDVNKKGTAQWQYFPPSPGGGRSIGGLRPPSLSVKNADAERRLWRSAAGWGESARSALRIPASPRTPPRPPAAVDPPPAGEGGKNEPGRRAERASLARVIKPCVRSRP